jgi:hypothetical protein
MPVPANAAGKRVINDWEFHYRGWETTKPEFLGRHTTDKNLFPDERKGFLDAKKLESLGLTSKQTKTGIQGECDSLFFYQLLLPICDSKKNYITGDSQKGFFANISPMINLYTCKFGMDGTYGKVFQPVTLQEVVNFEGIVHHHGVRGGGAGIHLCWDPSASDFDELVYKTMSYTMFLQIKRTYTLCNNYTAPKQKDAG